ncbi:hypothetical protein KQI68_06525 [Peptoniphilus sp. MSJ-1]|uniref:Uncharacterized protein n=1 Tax=Peptoniphilus ovalis TaxID=2841503 RepID=A0ABS6FH40_9FIRM|nr:hypothetical protein [Peptoniphilus ovalis]MBU5669492.1 hypothetical protein [Peptoniphilus ovalis]
MNSKNIKDIKINGNINKVLCKNDVVWEYPFKNFYYLFDEKNIIDNGYYTMNPGYPIRFNSNERFFCIKPVLLPEYLDYSTLKINAIQYPNTNDIFRFKSIDRKESIYFGLQDTMSSSFINNMKNKLATQPQWYLALEVHKSLLSTKKLIDAYITISLTSKYSR